MEMKIRLYLLKLLFKIINIYKSKYSFYTASIPLGIAHSLVLVRLWWERRGTGG
jgi:hypothetical protein